MDWNQLPQLVVATTVTLYWTCVIGMIIRSWSKYKVASGSLPKTRLEKRMWLLWVPTILAWNLLAWNSSNVVTESVTLLGMPLMTGLWYLVMYLATLSACFAFLTTTRCWMGMGRNWSMAVTPSKDTELITEGLFSKVRHPIYALSLMLMISTMVVVANWMMLVVGAIHCSMLFLKAWSEERYLCQTHGRQYEEYQQKTNRFIPVRALWTACLPARTR